MIKSIFRTLSLSFVTLAAFSAPASAGQSALLNLGAMPVGDKAAGPCAANAEVDRGWEAQQRLIDRRLAARVAEGLAFPGAIVVPPFESFAPYRKDVPEAARKPAKTAARTVDEHAPRH